MHARSTVAVVVLSSSLALAAAPSDLMGLQPTQAKAELRDAQGVKIGTALLTEEQDGVRVSMQVEKLPPGKHGVHVHQNGACDPPDFATAGPHFNPTSAHHGLGNPKGPHGGDLPNLEVAADGHGRLEFVAKGASLGNGPASMLKPGGTAVVVHASADDGKSDPAGNSGARIACGVVVKLR